VRAKIYNMKTEIKCCNRHDENVKLEWTFAFPGAEYWCPYCGANYGMMGAGEIRELTFTERREMIKYRKIGKEYLNAVSTFNCSYLEWEGKRITPKELPKAEKQRLQKIIDEWRYPVDSERVEA
jgi:hypothetical protein